MVAGKYHCLKVVTKHKIWFCAQKIGGAFGLR